MTRNDESLRMMKALGDLRQGTDPKAAAVALAEAGLQPLAVVPGGSAPCSPEAVGVSATSRGGAGWQLRARTAQEARRIFRAAENHYGEPANIGVVPDGQRIIMVDADTEAEVAALREQWAAWGGDVEDVDAMTTRTPGKRDTDGTWRHRHGGHLWVVLPAPMTRDDLPATMDVAVDGSHFSIRLHSSYALVPPSVRPEGPYTPGGAGAVWAPEGLMEMLEAKAEGKRATRLAQADARTRREAERAAAEERGEALPLASADEWSAATPWSEILDPSDWTDTGRQDSCGCPIYQRDGGASWKSATAHEPGCAYYAFKRGHGPLTVWTDNPPTAVAEMLEHVRETRRPDTRVLTKIEVAASYARSDLAVSSRISSFIGAMGWDSEGCSDAFSLASGNPAGQKGETGGVPASHTQAVASAVAAACPPEAAPAPAAPAGVISPVISDVIPPVTGTVTGPVTDAVPQAPFGIGIDVPGAPPVQVVDAPAPAPVVDADADISWATESDDLGDAEFVDDVDDVAPAPITDDVRLWAKEVGARLRRPLTTTEVQALAEEATPTTLPGRARTEAWGGNIAGWDARLVARIMSDSEETRRLFWWLRSRGAQANPVAVLLRVLQHVSHRVPANLHAPSPSGFPIPLSTYVVTVGASGSGKTLALTAAEAYARESGLILESQELTRVTGIDPASPQAMADPLFTEMSATAAAAHGVDTDGDDDGKKDRVVRMSFDPVADFEVDEFSAWFSSARLKMGLPAAAAAAWAGQNFLPASKNQGMRTVSGNFRVTLVGGLQPKLSGPLLATSGLGFVQRVVLVPAAWPLHAVLGPHDVPPVPEADAMSPRWPGITAAARLAAAAEETIGAGGGYDANRADAVAMEMTGEVSDRFEAMVSRTRKAVAEGEDDEAVEARAQRASVRIRLAALYAIFTGSTTVTRDHWLWAGMVLKVTDATWGHAAYGAKLAKAAVAEEDGWMDSTRRSAAASETVSRSRAVAEIVIDAVTAAGPDGVTSGSVRARLSKLQRGALDEVVAQLVAARRITERAAGRGTRLHLAEPASPPLRAVQ